MNGPAFPYDVFLSYRSKDKAVVRHSHSLSASIGERSHGPRKAAICSPEPDRVCVDSSAGCSV